MPENDLISDTSVGQKRPGENFLLVGINTLLYSFHTFIINIIIICFAFNFAFTFMHRHLVPVLCGHYQLLKKNLVRHFMYKASSLLHRHRGQKTSLKESLFLMVQ